VSRYSLLLLCIRKLSSKLTILRISLSQVRVSMTVFSLLLPAVAVAQSGPYDGILPFSTHEWGIDLANSGIYLTVPMRSKTGKIQYSSSTAGSNYYTSGLRGSGPPYNTYWNLYNTFSFRDTESQVSAVGSLAAQKCANPLYTYTTYSVTAIKDQSGALHQLNGTLSWIRNTNSQYCTNQQAPISLGVTDGSGYTMYVPTTGYPSIYDKGGNAFLIVVETYQGVGTDSFITKSTEVSDPDGASILWNGNTVTDTLNTTVLNLSNYSYTDVNGLNQQYTFTSTSLPVLTNFGCSGIYENSGGGPLTTSIQTPSGGIYTFAYEQTPGKSGYYTGRIQEITFPSGGSISYAYSDSSGHNGIDCSGKFVPTITVTVNDHNGYVGTFTYVHSSSSTSFTVTKTDPAGNQTVYTFSGELQTQVQYYQGVATGIPLKTIVTCYNANTTNCVSPTYLITLPVTQTDVYTSLGASASNHLQTTYDSNENVKSVVAYDYGASSPTLQTYSYYGQSWNGSSCSSYPSGSYISDSPCYIVTENSSGAAVGKTQITYSNTGHPLTVAKWTSGSNWLTSSLTYGTNGAAAGVLSAVTDVNGTTTSYSNFTCNGILAQTTTLPQISGESFQMTTSQAWNCNGGVPISSTDANGQTTPYGYVNESGTADPLWRRLSVTDPLGNTTWTDYSPGGTLPVTVETYLNFPAASPTSTVDNLSTFDGLDRLIKTQTRSAPGSSTFDNTVSYTYGWQSGNSGPCTTQPPFATGECTTQTIPGGTAVTTSQGDAIGRTLSITDGGGGTSTDTYTLNDDLSVHGPAPAGENPKQVQNQYDGLGRLTQSCAIGNGSSAACGQNTGSANGVTTSFAYTYPLSGTQVSMVTSTRGVQSRSTTYDATGRVTQIVNPETGALVSGVWVPGTLTKYYDSYTSCPTGYQGTAGQLAATKDPNGNLICYAYDSLNRLVGVNANGTSCRHFYYDNSTGYSGSIPSGVSTPTNSLGRIVDAATDSCLSGTLITDEWFSYDKDGRMTDMWELTPNSTQYYHSTAAFAANGAVTSLQLASPSLYTLTYGLDGEGRWDTLKDGSTMMVTGPTNGTMYDAAGHVRNVQLTGTTPDQDIYTYDPNTGRMLTFEFEVGNTPANLTGTVTWNPNGTVKNVAVVDGFNSGGSSTCYSDSNSWLGYGYDDWGRLLAFDCGSGNVAEYTQYDIYDNVTQTVPPNIGRTGWNFSPGYNPNNNHVTGNTYDSNGNTTADGGSNTYGYNEFSKVKWTATSGTPTCGSSGKCVTYDAFGRMVETSNGSAWVELWYPQVPGARVTMSGTSQKFSYWPSPGRGIYLESSTKQFLHPDWLGNDRIVSAFSGHTVSADRDYTPYGQQFSTFGSSNPQFGIFAGMSGDYDSGTLFDTPNREFAANQLRWTSPDPAGAGWNQYAYVTTNPLNSTDPLGLGPDAQQELKNAFSHACNVMISVTLTGTPCGPGIPGQSVAPVHCFLDNIETDCTRVALMEKLSEAVVCPNNDCTNLPIGLNWVEPGRGDPALRDAGAMVNVATDQLWVPGTGMFLRYPAGTVFELSDVPWKRDLLIFPMRHAPFATIGLPHEVTQTEAENLCGLAVTLGFNGMGDGEYRPNLQPDNSSYSGGQLMNEHAVHSGHTATDAGEGFAIVVEKYAAYKECMSHF
jgi:RHS repeat-associated protein